MLIFLVIPAFESVENIKETKAINHCVDRMTEKYQYMDSENLFSNSLSKATNYCNGGTNSNQNNL